MRRRVRRELSRSALADQAPPSTLATHVARGWVGRRCPRCKAPPGERCIGTPARGATRRMSRRRLTLAIRALPTRLSERAIGDIVAKHACTARPPTAHLTPRVLRHHTFCTLLADDGTRIELIGELAGHADIRNHRSLHPRQPEHGRDAIANTFDRGGRPRWAA